MDIFTILLVILFATAIVDLIVGVSNDAVNFLNSAIGSRVASFRTILLVASLGILLGSTFSSGMMEIARNGLFNPSYFSFREVMYIFLAVMLADIILLDIYNDLGLPTSTTVSLVFEILGAALIAGILSSLDRNISIGGINFSEIINFSSAITIVTGIFLSIFLAFIFGSLIQHISRILFTFSLKKSLKKYGAIFAGLAITTIIYFLLIKGAKGSSFISDEQVTWVLKNAWTLNLISLVVWSILIQCAMWWWNVNPLRPVVLLGTFALAMAFAGNDLVNFIGVAVGGLIAFQTWSASGASPDTFNMGVLSQKFSTPTWILLVAGFVMIVTLWTNAKAKKVTDTEVSLGRQDEGDEKFKANWLSRALVGLVIGIGRLIELMVPRRWSKTLARRFEKSESEPQKDDQPSFDLIRASVNLLVSSVLIAFGTSMKLPLSTTFVTFMVAMGSSFADQAWGRESAVYRVAGVMKVIAGWLITAVVAFSASALLSFILYKTGAPGAIVLTALAAFLLIRSHRAFSLKEKEEKENQVLTGNPETLGQVIDESKDITVKNLRTADKAFSATVESLKKEKKNSVTKSLEKIRQLRDQNDKVQNKIIKYVRKMPKGNLAASRLYLHMFDALQDLYQSVYLISESSASHLENFHSSPSRDYLKELDEIERRLHEYIQQVVDSVMASDYRNEKDIDARCDRTREYVDHCLDRGIKEIQKGDVGNRIGQLQIRLLLETKDILDAIQGMYALYRNYHAQDK